MSIFFICCDYAIFGDWSPKISQNHKIGKTDPDAFIFGGGVSNEIDFLSEIESMVKKFVIGKEYEGVFLKPKYGDASGVRGAARLGRSATY